MRINMNTKKKGGKRGGETTKEEGGKMVVFLLVRVCWVLAHTTRTVESTISSKLLHMKHVEHGDNKVKRVEMGHVLGGYSG